MSTAFDTGLSRLAAEGLDWVAFVPGDAGPRPLDDSDRGLLLVLARGPTFATRLGPLLGEHPFDTRSSALVTAFAREHLAGDDPQWRLVYPGDTPLDLRAWMRAGQVQYESRLGTGIRPDCGPWLAVRAAVWVALSGAHRDALRRRYPPLEGESPCATCADEPCRAACPADALGSPVRLEACVDHRLADASSCAIRCLARNACPVGAAFRYSPEQQAYHYGRSLQVIRRWRRGE